MVPWANYGVVLLSLVVNVHVRLVCLCVCVQLFDYISCRTVDNLHHQPPVDAVRRATDVRTPSGHTHTHTQDDTVALPSLSLSVCVSASSTRVIDEDE